MQNPPRPPYGVCLPAKLLGVVDGDTVDLSVLSGRLLPRIRLCACWAPEMKTAAGKAAKKAAEKFLDEADPKQLAVWIPAPIHLDNLLKNLTFDRIPGWVFIGETETLNHAMVAAGHATERKAKR